MISSILKAAGLMTLLFGVWILFTVQSGKDAGIDRLIDKASNLKTISISTDNSTGEKKQSGLASGNHVAENSSVSSKKDATQTEDNGGNRSKTIAQTGKSVSANLEGKAKDVKSKKAGLLAKAGHKKNSSKDDIDNLFNTKTILPEDSAKRITVVGESQGRFVTVVKEPTDEQLQSAQKRLTESILKLEIVTSGFLGRQF